MRRKDREVTQPEAIENIVRQCRVCRLGMIDGAEPYIVPMNFGYERRGGDWVFYFHSAREGRKLSVLDKNPLVALEMDGGHELITGETACDYGYRYQSVMGVGRAVIVTDGEEKKHALSLLMARQTGGSFSFTEAMASHVAVIKVTTDRLTGKRHE